MDPTRIETTYAELRDNDVLIARDGARWHVSGVEKLVETVRPGGHVDFWLGDARTKVRAHHMTKPAGDPCTVERVPTHADDVATLDAGSTLPVPSLPGVASPEEDARRAALLAKTFGDPDVKAAAAELVAAGVDPGHAAGVAAVTVGLAGAQVDADVTAAEVDAARQATDDDPVVLPLFETMTDLEQRSHMYVLHGVFTDDVEDRRERSAMHAAAHRDRAQNKLKGRHTPHVHSEAVTA
jgi:hypothetical protein